jgi:thioredoxin reductase (NADPH)
MLRKKHSITLETIFMNNKLRGLPVTRSHIEQIFPNLTPAQMRRVTTRGQIRTTKLGEVLYEPGETAAPFYIVVSGELIA